MICIYALSDATGCIRYIGKTNDPEYREKQHAGGKFYWATMRILAVVEDSEAKDMEAMAVYAYHRLNPGKLQNKYLLNPTYRIRRRVECRTMAMIKAIETRYAGYRFRSRLEARWAVFFDELEMDWEYEPQGFELSTSQWKIKYLPDFWLENAGQWAEVKGYLDTDGMRRLCNIASVLTRCDKGNDLVIFGDVPRQHSMLWPAQLHYHDGLWAVPWDPYAAGCPLARPRVAVQPTTEMAAHLTDGFPFGRPDWATDGLERARQARFEWGEHG